MEILFVGSGIQCPSQMSLEAIEAIRSADLVISIAHSDEIMKDFFSKHKIDGVAYLSNVYFSGEKDVDNYERVYNAILNLAKDVKKTVVVLSGHPRIAVTIVQWFQTNAMKLNAIVAAQAGISSFDTMLNDVQLDPIEKGTALLDANRVLLFNQVLNPHFNYFIYHICSVGTPMVHVDDPSIGNRIDLLTQHLFKSFEGDHDIFIIESGNCLSPVSRIVRTTIEDLPKQVSEITFASTLYIPGKNPSSYNRDFYKLLKGS